MRVKRVFECLDAILSKLTRSQPGLAENVSWLLSYSLFSTFLAGNDIFTDKAFDIGPTFMGYVDIALLE